MELIHELETFLNSSWHAFKILHTLNKGLIAGFVGYITFKLSGGSVKTLTSKYLGFAMLADDPKNRKYDQNKIYLHLFPRRTLANTPNGSPFILKLETWMRMVKVDYETVETNKMSRRTQQWPYIFHKGKEITDSDFIIEYLENELDLDNTEGLNLEQQSFSRACTKMVDENTNFAFLAFRSIYAFKDMMPMIDLGMPKWIQNIMLPKMSVDAINRTKVRGIGRKSFEEICRIGKTDIQAISNYLGNKNYIFGDKMCKVDCAIFAHLMIGVYIMPKSPFSEFVNQECKNIMPYLERIKSKCWPDWDKLTVNKVTFN